MGVIIPIVIFYAVFVIMELPLLRSGGRGRLLFCVLLLLNLVSPWRRPVGCGCPRPRRSLNTWYRPSPSGCR